jgi:hypothetical protein
LKCRRSKTFFFILFKWWYLDTCITVLCKEKSSSSNSREKSLEQENFDFFHLQYILRVCVWEWVQYVSCKLCIVMVSSFMCLKYRREIPRNVFNFQFSSFKCILFWYRVPQSTYATYYRLQVWKLTRFSFPSHIMSSHSLAIFYFLFFFTVNNFKPWPPAPHNER